MAILTINHKINSVNNFINSIKDSRNSYYCYVGKADPWLNSNGQIDETAVPVANGSVEQIEHDIYRDMIFAKLLTNTDVSYMTKRYDWANGAIYSGYDAENANIYFDQSYVVTDTNDVYKCIFNGNSPLNPNGVPSTIKPSVNQTIGNFQTSDGYIWKYMYTCDPSIYTNFQTSNYIPVTPNNEVIGNSVPGSIDVLQLENAGNNYQVFEEGFLKSYVNNYVVELPSISSPYDNYYTDSSIYLKAGSGAGQIRTISSYDGLNKLLAVHPPFNLYENLKLSNINGMITEGDLITQKISFVTFIYKTGTYNDGDLLVQSDSSAFGAIRISNSTVFTIENLSNTDFTLDHPVYNTSYSHTQKNGKVNITANGTYVNAVSGTNFTSDYSVGQYIRVGETSNTNIRRITSVNSTVITVSHAFSNTITTANNYLVNTAFSVDSITKRESLGSVIYTNLNSAEVTYSNVVPVSSKFILGETVVLVDGANTNQGANGTVSFYDEDNIILSDVQGTISANLYLYGLSSQTKAYIDSNDSYPNITVDTVEGGFYSGVNITVRYANGVPTANANIVTKYSSPNELTEYIISPKVNIDGDGYGALAYCTVDLSGNNPARGITTINLIDSGREYTYANVYITANNLYGNGAIVKAQISPVNGHGSEPYVELGAIYAGVSKKLDTAANESYKFPLYGSYRKVGIIENPLIEDAIFNVTDFDRSELVIDTVSGSFATNEILYQSSSNAAGIVVFANTTYIELKNTKGTFVASDDVYGLSSDATANCVSFTTKYFQLAANLAALSEITPGGTAQINQKISNTQIRVTDVVGNFETGDYIYEPSTNAYATISSIYISNGTIDASSTFGRRINQTARITLSSNTKPFEQFEYVNQEITQAYGMVVSANDEIDVVYDAVPASNFTVGEVLYNTTTMSNAVIIAANSVSKYLKLSAVYNTGYNDTTNRPFNVGDSIQTLGGVKVSNINSVYNVLILSDVGYQTNSTYSYGGNFQIGNYQITGNVSGAVATVTLTGSITLPEFKHNSGKVIYAENISKFDVDPTSTEQVKLIIKF